MRVCFDLAWYTVIMVMEGEGEAFLSSLQVLLYDDVQYNTRISYLAEYLYL
jgi:hypothetical protein